MTLKTFCENCEKDDKFKIKIFENNVLIDEFDCLCENFEEVCKEYKNYYVQKYTYENEDVDFTIYIKKN